MHIFDFRFLALRVNLHLENQSASCHSSTSSLCSSFEIRTIKPLYFNSVESALRSDQDDLLHPFLIYRNQTKIGKYSCLDVSGSSYVKSMLN